MLAVGYFCLSLLPTTKLGMFYGTLTAHWGLFFGTTIAILLYLKINLKETLALHSPKLKHLIAVVLMAPACHILLGVFHSLLKPLGREHRPCMEVLLDVVAQKSRTPDSSDQMVVA